MKRNDKELTYVRVIILLAAFASLLAALIIMGTPRPQPQPSPLPTQSYRQQLSTIWLPLVQRASTKKGVGLTYGHCGDVQRVGASWFYTWSPWPRDCEGVESVPMIWGSNDIGKTPRGTSAWLLGFNEPDRSNQANLTPGAAAELWREIETLYGLRSNDKQLARKLVSPAVSHTDVDWLRRFVAAYVDLYGEMPQLDALAVHCYANDVDKCIATVSEVIELAESWGVLGGVWLTEFSTWPKAGEEVGIALDRARKLIEVLDGEPGVVRYAWFAARIRGDEWWVGPSTALVEFDGLGLTMYGEMYKGE